MTTLEALKQVREKIAAGWTQEVYARDAQGAECGATDPRAVSYCIYGAIDSVRLKSDNGDQRYELSQYMLKELDFNLYQGLTSFNDNPRTTKQDVLWLIDRAIARVGGVKE